MKIKCLIFFSGIFLMGCQKAIIKTDTNKDTIAVKIDTGWVPVAPLPVNRAYATSFTVNNKAYICGGVIDFTKSYDSDDPNMYMYDPQTNKWVKKAGIPPRFNPQPARKSPFSFIIDGKVYAGGGVHLDGNDAWDIDTYDPLKDEWTYAGPQYPQIPLSNTIATSYKGKGYIFTMESDTQYGNNKIYEFDPVKKEIKRLELNLGIIDIKDKWIATDINHFLCGTKYSYAFFEDINPTKNEFKRYDRCCYYPAIPKGEIVTHNGIFYKNSVYVCFGNAGHLYRFNFKNEFWEIISLMDLNVSEGATAFIVGSKFYIAGGNNGIFSPSTNKVWAIDLDKYPE